MSSSLKEDVVSASTCLPPPASTYEKGKYVLIMGKHFAKYGQIMTVT